MDAANSYSRNDDNNSDSSKNILKTENSKLMDDNVRAIRINPTPALNPPPPPLPGVFIFDRPNQQKKSHHMDTNCNVSTEPYNQCNNISNLPSSEYSVQYSKVIHHGQGTHDNIHLNSNLYRSSPTNRQSALQLQPPNSDDADPLIPSDTGIHHLQSLEPIAVNTFEDSLQSSETKVYHQLHVISPNQYKLNEESKLYHEMSPVSLTTSTLRKENYNQKNYQQLNPIRVVEDPPRLSQTSQELKPLTSHFYDPPQYANSKLYQQLCQPQIKEEKSNYQPEVRKYQQFRPATAIDFEQSGNKKDPQATIQQFSNIPMNAHPTTTKTKTETSQGIRDSVINKGNSLNIRPAIQSTKSTLHPLNSQTININDSHIGFKEDKPKVYLELRNPGIRSQLPKSAAHQSQYPDTPPKYENKSVPSTLHTSSQSLSRLQKPSEFKLPGPYEFNLPQQNSPNKYKLPKLLGHNEYRVPELILNPMEKRHESNTVPFFETQKASASLIPSTSTGLNKNNPFNGVRNKIPLSLPRTPLCYGDPGVNSNVSYYPDKSTVISVNSESSVIQPSSSNFEKQTEISAPVQNTSYSVPMNAHSKLREELLKPVTLVRKLCGITAEEVFQNKGFTLKDSNSQLINSKDEEIIKVKVTSEEIHVKPFSCGYNSPPLSDNIHEPSDQIDPKSSNAAIIEKLTIADDRPKRCEQFSENVTSSEIKSVKVQENMNKVSGILGLEGSENFVSSKAVSVDQSVRNLSVQGSDAETKGKDNTFPIKSNNLLRQKNSDIVLTENSDRKHDTNFALLKEDPVEEILDSNIKPINEQSKLRNREDKGNNFHKDSDRSEKELVKSKDDNIIDKNTDKDKGCFIKEISNDVNKTSVDSTFVHNSEEVLSKNTSSCDLKERHLANNLCESVSRVTENNSVLTNSKTDYVFSIKQEPSAPEVKLECSGDKEVKAKRKYTKRTIPENERRKHTRRKASWGLKDIIKREKRTYTKRNTKKIPKSEKDVIYYSEKGKTKSTVSENLVNEEVQIKVEILSEDEDKRNNALRPSFQLLESAPRKKRKYTKRKIKNKDLEGEISNTKQRVKRKYTKKGARKETTRERTLKNKSSKKLKYEFVDPLEEGLISDDEGEVVFLGFDMTDEEDETILGFEMDTDEDPGNDLHYQFLTKLEEGDFVTVECDPRSLLQPATETTSCSQCNKSFDSHMDLVAHLQWHTATQTPHTHSYVCTVCCRGFPTQLQLDRHVKWTHEGGKKHKCAKCPKMFTTRAYAKRHTETAHKEEETKITTFYCGECAATFQTEAKLKDHETKVHKKTLYQCEDCLKYFQKLSNLERHKLSHNKESEGQAFPCAYCNEKFSTRESLHAHWPVHTDKKVFTCDICNSNFTALNSLKRHRILHAGEKLFRCEICQRSFSLLSTLKTHLLIHTGARKFECNLCGKLFNRRDVLNAHQWVHTGEKNFQCDICSEKFRWRHAVKSHKLIYHSTEKPYACEICGKRFSHPDSFKKHAEVHAERLFYCQICLKAFSRASTLKAHITTHTNLKPFFCDKCHKGFRSKSHLKNHFLVHTKEKPWLCKFCNKTYKDRTQLRRHKRVVHCKAFYKKILPSFPEVYETMENFEVVAEAQQAGYGSQSEQSSGEIDSDSSKHFISLPVESDFPKIEENIVSPSVFLES